MSQNVQAGDVELPRRQANGTGTCGKGTTGMLRQQQMEQARNALALSSE